MFRGYTLIELLIVVSVVAILSTVGFLNLSNYQARREVDLAAETIVAAIRDVSSRATTGENNSNWGLRFENEPLRLTPFAFSGACAFTAPQGNTMTLRSTLRIADPVTPLLLCFQKITGSSMLGHVTIQIDRIGEPSSPRQITVDANGRISF